MSNSQLFIDLENHMDLTEWDNLKPEICRGIALLKILHGMEFILLTVKLDHMLKE